MKKNLSFPSAGSLLLSGARPIVAILLALIVGALIIVFIGVNPFEAYAALIDGAFGSPLSLSNTAVRMAPILLGGLCVAIGFKAGLLNVGAEGYIYIGGAAAAAVGLIKIPGPDWVHFSVCLLAGFLGGALWGLLVSYLRAYKGANEVVITIMMNYVAIYVVSFLTQNGFLSDPEATYPMSPMIMDSARLPILFKGTNLHLGFVVGICVAVVLFVLLYHTPFGFKTMLIGENQEAARYAGVNVKRQIFLALLIGSGFAGLGGACEVLGLRLRLYDFFAAGMGSDPTAVALMANGHPLGVIFTSLLFGALKSGAGKMQSVVGIETSVAAIIQALALLFVIAIGFSERIRHEKRLSRSPADEKKEIVTCEN